MIKINTLYSLENISDCYYVREDGQIININTGHVKKQTLGPRGYYYVSLNEKVTNRQVKVTVHKIIALAFISNGPYEDINHRDGNKQNNAVENLEFCTQRENVIHAWQHGLIVRKERVFRANFENYALIGTMKQLAKEMGANRATLYSCFYQKRSCRMHGMINIVEVFDKEGLETIERVNLA